MGRGQTFAYDRETEVVKTTTRTTKPSSSSRKTGWMWQARYLPLIILTVLFAGVLAALIGISVLLAQTTAKLDTCNANRPQLQPGITVPSTVSVEPTVPACPGEPDTSAETTVDPDTSAEPTVDPDTSAEPTVDPDTSAEPTVDPDTSAETSVDPDPSAETTDDPDTSAETTVDPDTSAETTVDPDTSAPPAVSLGLVQT
ncbi:hypothetical protein BV898_17851 [Hypsibius exemplaris]|uniref:Uncharacterized protein n=1 Tax=Hypsibius exemplaris TaxID=2072580 RepID=A0A9X6RN81_HYPEX|nr:hypothetical protein BV898_17851 [Hypsibius exemplaris]